MKLDSISNQCIIVAVFAVILSIYEMAIEITELWWAYRHHYDNLSQYAQISCLKIGACLAAALISMLKIIGIEKRSTICVAPWVLAAFGVLAYFIYDKLITVSYIHADVAFYPIVVFGVACIILHPLLTVIADIRREKANAVKKIGKNKCDFIRI